jgi:TetR/AcrR family transcriptional regulator, cholesterol catabolism regulator
LENQEKTEKLFRDCGLLFSRYGVKSISMDDIARELGISKKTLYQFVENKADLLRKSLAQLHKDFNICADDIDNKNLNAIDELLEMSKHVREEFQKLNPSHIFDFQKYYPEVFKEHTQAEKDLAYRLVRKNLEKGIVQGLYRPDLDIDLLAGLYIQKMQTIYDPDFFSQLQASPEKIFEVMFENHIRGICNNEGISYFEQQKQHLNFE